MTQQQQIRIFDTTLRDGEQSPGASLSIQEKIEIAKQLELLGVDVIEAGFPITSDGDFQAVSAIAQVLEKPIICGLARCVSRDIDRAGEAVSKGLRARKNRIHVFCATSKIHREHKLNKAKDQILKLAVESVEHALTYVDDVEFSPEDASRTELDYLVEIVHAVIEAGATTINMPDTVGYAVPSEYGHIFSYVREKLPIIDQQGIYLSSHCHNDLGLAVANSLAAMEQGARQIECTINGIGERAGNAALEEFVMAINTRKDYFSRYTTAIQTHKIFPISKMVSTYTGLHVQRNKAIIGENAFAHESGIHQDGMLKNRNTYEIMDPREIGVPESKLVLGKHSGRHAFKDRIIALGYTLTDEVLETAFVAFKELADKKKDVFDEDIQAILDTQMNLDKDRWSLEQFQIHSGTQMIATATVTLQSPDGKSITDAATGDGPVDAICSAIQRMTGIRAALEDYQTRSITSGKDAQGEVTLQIKADGKIARGRGLSTDVIQAAGLAYLSALNRLTKMSADKQDQKRVEQP